MKIVSKEISTQSSTVPVINTEVWASWPFVWINVSPSLWWKKICDDRYSILIVIPDKALIGISRIRSHHSCSLIWCLCWIVIRNDYLMSWLYRWTLSWIFGVINGFQSISNLVWHTTCNIGFATRPLSYLLLFWFLLRPIIWSRWSLANSSIIWLQRLYSNLGNLCFSKLHFLILNVLLPFILISRCLLTYHFFNIWGLFLVQRLFICNVLFKIKLILLLLALRLASNIISSRVALEFIQKYIFAGWILAEMSTCFHTTSFWDFISI